MKTSKNQAVMPINVVTMIDEKAPVFKMAEIPEKSDYRKLHSDYRRRWRKIDPEVVFSIVVYANMRGIFSSRAIEEACKTDIRFMWLLQYEPAPDHTTIARCLGKNMNGCAEGLFYQLVQKLSEIGEIEFESMFVDGTKTGADANKYR